jgi:hypothetical protein
MKRSNSLVFSSSVFVESCSDKIYTNFVYKWSVFDTSRLGTRLNNISSISQNPSSFSLKPYTLSSGKTFLITLQANYTPSSMSASSSVYVTVQQGSVVAVISDGNVKQIQSMTNFTIDCSKSYDEDIQVRSLSYKSLSFSWSCVQLEPVFSPDCLLEFFSKNRILLPLLLPYL